MVVSIGVAIGLVAFAYFLHWRGWGTGKWNVGPRLTALIVLTVAVGLAPIVAYLVEHVTGWLTAFASALARGWGYPQAVPLIDGIGTYGPGVAGLLLLVLWIAAILPGKKERMTWTIAWAGALIPGLLLLVAWASVRQSGTVIVSAVSTGVAQVTEAFLAARNAR